MIKSYKIFINNFPVYITNDHLHTRSVGETQKTIFCHSDKELFKTIRQLESVKNNSQKPGVILLNTMTLMNVFFSYYKNIEAAGGVVLNKNEEVLLIKRNGIWDLPKGKIEKKESKESAAIREVAEETGLSDIHISKELAITYHTYFQAKERYLKKTYWFLMKYSLDLEGIPQITEGITELKWVLKNDLGIYKKKTFESVKDVLALIRK